MNACAQKQWLRCMNRAVTETFERVTVLLELIARPEDIKQEFLELVSLREHREHESSRATSG